MIKNKIISLSLIALCLLPSVSFANQSGDFVGVTETPPYLSESTDSEQSYEPYGFEIPRFPFFVNLKPYHFSGQSSQNPLYSNYVFVGKTTYHIEASSLSSDEFDVIAYQRKGFFNRELNSQTASSGGSVDFYVNTKETSDRVFLKFTAPCHFDGYIS